MSSRVARPDIEHSEKRIRIVFGGEVVVDTTRALLVWEHGRYPQYYVPIVDVRMELLAPTRTVTQSATRGEATHFTVRAGGFEAVDAAWCYSASPIAEIGDHLRFEWAAMDQWFEEDAEVFVHPRDPFTRLDILPSSRHVEVQIDDVTVADTIRPTLLFETGLRTRYYLPLDDIRRDLLVPSSRITRCPYKGIAQYYSVRVGGRLIEDVAWFYPDPVPESADIARLVAFFDERTKVIVEGQATHR